MVGCLTHVTGVVIRCLAYVTGVCQFSHSCEVDGCVMTASLKCKVEKRFLHGICYCWCKSLSCYSNKDCNLCPSLGNINSVVYAFLS